MHCESCHKGVNLYLAGTYEQSEIIYNYPKTTQKERLNAPFIERFNGNIAAKNNDFLEAIKHYQSALA